MEKTKYCKVTIDGSFIIFNSLGEAFQSIPYDVESFLENDSTTPVEIKVEYVYMTDEEFAALPEFDGF